MTGHPLPIPFAGWGEPGLKIVEIRVSHGRLGAAGTLCVLSREKGLAGGPGEDFFGIARRIKSAQPEYFRIAAPAGEDSACVFRWSDSLSGILQ
jgi:hypothetical protein